MLQFSHVVTTFPKEKTESKSPFYFLFLSPKLKSCREGGGEYRLMVFLVFTQEKRGGWEETKEKSKRPKNLKFPHKDA